MRRTNTNAPWSTRSSSTALPKAAPWAASVPGSRARPGKTRGVSADDDRALRRPPPPRPADARRTSTRCPRPTARRRTSAKTGSKTPMVGSPLQGIGAPSLTKAAHNPNVLSQTLLPPSVRARDDEAPRVVRPSAASLPFGSGPPAAAAPARVTLLSMACCRGAIAATPSRPKVENHGRRTQHSASTAWRASRTSIESPSSTSGRLPSTSNPNL